MNKMSKMPDIVGIPKFTKPLHFCDACARAKAVKQSSHSRPVTIRSSNLMEYFCIDIITIPVKSKVGGFNHILMIVEDNSRYVFCFYMQRKNETLEHLKQFVQNYVIPWHTKYNSDAEKLKNLAPIFQVHYYYMSVLQADSDTIFKDAELVHYINSLGAKLQ